MTPKSGWENNTLIAEVGVIFAAIVILLSVLTRVWLVSKEHKNKFKDIRRNFIRMSFSVRCNSCHARGGIVTRDINYGKEAEEISKAKNEAIEKWNTRAK